MITKRGLLVVVDGVDTKARTEHARVVEDYLQGHIARGVCQVQRQKFPRHGANSAWLADGYSRGIYGPPDSVDPRLASMLFAVDRMNAGLAFRPDLINGCHVVVERYTVTSAAYQGLKIRSPQKRREFFEWLMRAEYESCMIPRPSVNFILISPQKTDQDMLANVVYRQFSEAFPDTCYPVLDTGDPDFVQRHIRDHLDHLLAQP